MPDRRFSRRRFLALGSAGALAACATVPDADDYLRRTSVAGLPQDAASDDILQRQFVLQQALSESPLTAGNEVRLLRDGQQAFPSMFAAMHQARDHINLEYFIFEDVQVGGTHLSDLLIGKLAAGVAVNIIYDDYGSRDTPASLFAGLRNAGARVVVFNPINALTILDRHSPNDRDHRKIMVVDGRIGFVGGINLARVYENAREAGFPADGRDAEAYWRDTAMELRGPAVAELQRLFFDTWARQKGDPVQSCRDRVSRRCVSSAAFRAKSAHSTTSRSRPPFERPCARSGCQPAISFRRIRSARTLQGDAPWDRSAPRGTQPH
jgi:cardiolipin synthase A/B